MLTALEVEYQAVRQHLTNIHTRRHAAGTLFEVGRLDNGQPVAIAATGPGNQVAAVLTERAIAMFQPAALLFVGVAGALMADVGVGDVVVATKIYAYHGGTEGGDGFGARPHAWDAPHALEQIARHIARKATWVPAEARPPQVHFRPIAAGEVVLDDRDSHLAKWLRHAYSDAAAIEMEGAGVALAGHLNRALPVLAIRGISDSADGQKQAADRCGGQSVAAANAAAFAAAVARDFHLASAL